MNHLILVILCTKEHLIGLLDLASLLCHFHCCHKLRGKPSVSVLPFFIKSIIEEAEKKESRGS